MSPHVKQGLAFVAACAVIAMLLYILIGGGPATDQNDASNAVAVVDRNAARGEQSPTDWASARPDEEASAADERPEAGTSTAQPERSSPTDEGDDVLNDSGPPLPNDDQPSVDPAFAQACFGTWLTKEGAGIALTLGPHAVASVMNLSTHEVIALNWIAQGVQDDSLLLTGDGAPSRKIGLVRGCQTGAPEFDLMPSDGSSPSAFHLQKAGRN